MKSGRRNCCCYYEGESKVEKDYEGEPKVEKERSWERSKLWWDGRGEQ